MRIPFQEDVAILILSELATMPNQHVLPLSEIAKKHQISPLFLKKIARNLKQAGLLLAREGTHGGYALSKDPLVITLWDVYRALESFNTSKPQAAGSEPCPVNVHCLPHIIRQTLMSTLSDSLRAISLRSIVDKAFL